MRYSHLVAGLLTSALNMGLLLPVQAQESGESLFRMDIKAPILFSGGNGDTSGETPPIETQNPLTISLQGTSPFEVNVGEPMSAIDLRHFATVDGDPNVTNADLTWTASTPGDLPPGVTLSGSSLLGTPTTVNSYDFEIVASHPDAADAGRQVYTIIVNGVELKVKEIAVGSSHTCALTTAGGVKCWGHNGSGELGNDDTLINHHTPVDVDGLTSGVASISSGSSHTCALTIAGGVKCWGNDSYGQLGNDETMKQQSVPVDVYGLTSGVASISAGSQHTCAVMITGRAKCWGYDYYGQAGHNPVAGYSYKTTPVNVQGITETISSISAGGGHTCALTTEGGVKCWGRDNEGQLGDDATLKTQPRPVDVYGLTSGVASISAGDGYTCAVMNTGRAKCWGADNFGQLGNDDTLQRQPRPVDVYGLTSGVASISARGAHTCAVMNTGGAKCWGRDNEGQLGDDATLKTQPRPVDVYGLTSGVASINAYGYHTCAVMTSGDAKCWGLDAWGQLGNGPTSSNQPTPTDVLF